MKSLLISSVYFPPQVGGVSQYMASVVKCLGRAEVCCLTGAGAKSKEKDWSSEIEEPFGARIYRRPSAFDQAQGLQMLSLGASLTEILIREHPQVVQLATASEGYVALQLNRWLKLPYVIYAHGNEILEAADLAWQKPKWSLQRASRVLANSQFTAGLVAELGVQKDKIAVLHPGCDVERFQPREVTMTFRQQILGEQWNKRVILTIGNLVERKGHDMVIRALPRVLQAVPDVVYLIAGDGRHRAQLERIALDMGVQKNVIFAGQAPDDLLPQIYALADVFIMPSRMRREFCDVEGFGMVFLEASACRKPVIAGRCGGIPDAVVDGVTGLLVDPSNSEDIAKSMIRILLSPGLAEQFGEQGRERVLREFTWDRFAGRLRELLNTIVTEHSSGAS
jgi:phosphatidyl-myo-inositol dimannoside synthase